MAIAFKKYAKIDTKHFYSCPILLDIFTLLQMFCPWLRDDFKDCLTIFCNVGLPNADASKQGTVWTLKLSNFVAYEMLRKYSHCIFNILKRLTKGNKNCIYKVIIAQTAQRWLFTTVNKKILDVTIIYMYVTMAETVFL